MIAAVATIFTGAKWARHNTPKTTIHTPTTHTFSAYLWPAPVALATDFASIFLFRFSAGPVVVVAGAAPLHPLLSYSSLLDGWL